jgi:hypothetical protein
MGTSTYFALPPYQKANQLSFFDVPNDPLLPMGQTLQFTTQLVGLQGAGPAYSVIPTSILFTWARNLKGRQRWYDCNHSRPRRGHQHKRDERCHSDERQPKPYLYRGCRRRNQRIH